MVPIIHASEIITKTNWLGMVCLIRATYKDPDSDIVRQAISQCNQMHDYLLTYGFFIPLPIHKDPIDTQDKPITKKDKQAATVVHFGIPLLFTAATRVTTAVTQSATYQQSNLLAFWLMSDLLFPLLYLFIKRLVLYFPSTIVIYLLPHNIPLQPIALSPLWVLSMASLKSL